MPTPSETLARRKKAVDIADSNGKEIIYTPKTKTYTQEDFPKTPSMPKLKDLKMNWAAQGPFGIPSLERDKPKAGKIKMQVDAVKKAVGKKPGMSY